MPRRYYQHICRDHDLRMINISPCNVCGAPGVYSGWGYSGIESMGHYKRLYGLPPIGPHRPFVDGLRLTESCTACKGQGLFDVEHGRDYASCPKCDGIGRRLVCSPDELKAVQQIAWLLIEHAKRTPSYARDVGNPIDRVLGLIADEPVCRAAQRFLDEQRFTQVVRILTWQGILDPENPLGVERDQEDEGEDEEGLLLEDKDALGSASLGDGDEDAGESRRPGPPNMEDISRVLERLSQLDLLND